MNGSMFDHRCPVNGRMSPIHIRWTCWYGLNHRHWRNRFRAELGGLRIHLSLIGREPHNEARTPQ